MKCWSLQLCSSISVKHKVKHNSARKQRIIMKMKMTTNHDCEETNIIIFCSKLMTDLLVPLKILPPTMIVKRPTSFNQINSSWNYKTATWICIAQDQKNIVKQMVSCKQFRNEHFTSRGNQHHGNDHGIVTIISLMQSKNEFFELFSIQIQG